jgi:hypothetical protein
MNNASLHMFNCPWCGVLLFELLYRGANITMPCGSGIGSQAFGVIGCRKPIAVQVDDNDMLRSVSRAAITEGDNDIRTVNQPQVSIGKMYGGNVAVGGNVTAITNIYNDTVKAIDEAKNIDIQQKKQAKGALAYFKEYAPTVLPIAADIIKKTLGL